MNEESFAEELVSRLRPHITSGEVATKKSVFHSLSFDEEGNIPLNVDGAREPIRGSGTGFEQDILVFERVRFGTTSIIPRVIAEVKFVSVTTHDALTYSDKARRIRTVYPYVRYGLILGAMSNIPARVLRLGEEFDFIAVVEDLQSDEELAEIAELLQDEFRASKDLGKVFSGAKKATRFVRRLNVIFTDGQTT